MKSYFREDCRLCKSKKIEKVLHLEPTPAADSYLRKDQLNINQELIPLDLFLCSDCGHTQLGHVIDAEEVYLNYIYESESTLGLGDHFRKAAEDIFKKFEPNLGGLVLDIGSNDGILLSHFQKLGMKVLGVDPMPGIAEKASAKGIPTIGKFFNDEVANDIKKLHGIPSIICSNNLVADTDDLDSFVNSVKILMDKNTIFFFETFYFYLQIKNNVWDFTYHEHYSYFTIRPLIQYFHKNNLELIDVEPNLTKGGSMRCVVQLKGGNRKISDSVHTFLKLEEIEGFQTKEIFEKYDYKIQKGKSEYKFLMDKLKEDKYKIAAYGASATSTTLIYNYEMQNDFNFIVDDFKAKQGLFCPGTKIPVYDAQKIYEEKPDYVVILAWRYWKKIVDKNKDFLSSGGKFIIPLPELKIISKEDIV